jgi:hypothetical protein
MPGEDLACIAACVDVVNATLRFPADTVPSVATSTPIEAMTGALSLLRKSRRAG